MINIDSRLLESVDPDELYLLSRLVNRMNRDNVCWPGTELLRKECKWSRSKLLRVKKGLYDKGLLSFTTRRKENSPELMSNIYKLETSLISNYIPSVKTDTTPIQDGHHIGVNFDTTLVHQRHHLVSGMKQEVLTSEVLTNEELINEELKREKYISFQISNTFQELIETFFTQFDDHKFYVQQEQFYGHYDKAIDETSLAFLKKINWAAEKISEALRTLKRERLQVGDGKIYRGKGVSDNVFKEVRVQVNAYHDYCRLTKTFMTTDPEKLPEKLIQADWPFKLFDHVKDDIKNQKYDPGYDQDLLSVWLREMYYYQDCYDTWLCKRFNNRIVSGGEEYLKIK